MGSDPNSVGGKNGYFWVKRQPAFPGVPSASSSASCVTVCSEVARHDAASGRGGPATEQPEARRSDEPRRREFAARPAAARRGSSLTCGRRYRFPPLLPSGKRHPVNSSLASCHLQPQPGGARPGPARRPQTPRGPNGPPDCRPPRSLGAHWTETAVRGPVSGAQSDLWATFVTGGLVPQDPPAPRPSEASRAHGNLPGGRTGSTNSHPTSSFCRTFTV